MNLKEIVVTDAPPVVYTPRVVKERVRLGGGWVISIAIPDPAKDATNKMVPSVQVTNFTDPTGNAICYARFAQNVTGVEVNGVRKGGRVFFHLHHAEPMQFVGKCIFCVAEVFRKVMDDSSAYVYVDLKLAPEGTEPTHRLSVMPCKAVDIERRDGFAFFETPVPMVGVIVVAPFGTAIVRRKPAQKVAQVRPAKSVKVPTPIIIPITSRESPPVLTLSPELDRLVNVKGWRIGHRSGKSKAAR